MKYYTYIVIRAGIRRMLFRLADSEDPDKTASAVWSGS